MGWGRQAACIALGGPWGLGCARGPVPAVGDRGAEEMEFKYHQALA